MKPQAFQPGELRDEYDQIIRAGAYGKKTPFVNSDNSAILDYIINNFDALYAQIPNGRAYVKSVNNITPDSNGNVTVNVGSGGGTGTNITVDSALSSTSTNPVQNKVLYAALNNKLDKNGTATYAARDSSGNIISSTYARKTDLNSYVKSINNMKPDSAGNVNISSSGGGSNITVDFTLDSTSSNAIANKAVYAALNNKLDKTGTAAAATKATQDSYGNVIVTTYARKSDLSGYVKTINNQEPDANGNINISTGGAGTGPNITVDSTLSSTSNNPIANKAVYAAVNNKLDKNGTAMYASRDSSGNVFGSTYATKTELSKCVKSINNLTPDGSGNVNISTSGGGTNITVDTTLSSTSTNAIQNKAVYAALSGKLDKIGTAAAATKATQDGAGNVIATTYIKTVNNLKPDASGNVNVNSSSSGVSTSTQNTWTAQQNFQRLKFNFESFATSRISGTYDSPATSVATYNVTGALTLDMSTLAGMISNGDASIFTAYIASNGSYALSITNAGTLKYAGSAADLAITASGLLLNIFLTKNTSGVVTSIAQATKLS
ncbi:hypothetical protein [Phascolarctobacterium succinatutens]|uniref:hypothetical protein n=1 Tax=Phascolarctobacterium succinatutens TaxID=626940 RepID=UPI0026EDB320|nr:hypothetical protein [Phascolarctobacterium succinatutens]